MFEEEIFKVIEPTAIQESIEACEVPTQKHQDKIKHLGNELENAQYESDRAFTQYNAGCDRRTDDLFLIISIL